VRLTSRAVIIGCSCCWN